MGWAMLAWLIHSFALLLQMRNAIAVESGLYEEVMEYKTALTGDNQAAVCSSSAGSMCQGVLNESGTSVNFGAGSGNFLRIDRDEWFRLTDIHISQQSSSNVKKDFISNKCLKYETIEVKSEVFNHLARYAVDGDLTTYAGTARAAFEYIIIYLSETVTAERIVLYTFQDPEALQLRDVKVLLYPASDRYLYDGGPLRVSQWNVLHEVTGLVAEREVIDNHTIPSWQFAVITTNRNGIHLREIEIYGPAIKQRIPKGARIDVGKSGLATQQNLSQLMESIDNSEDPVLANKWLKVSFPYPICLRKLSAQIIPRMSNILNNVEFIMPPDETTANLTDGDVSGSFEDFVGDYLMVDFGPRVVYGSYLKMFTHERSDNSAYRQLYVLVRHEITEDSTKQPSFEDESWKFVTELSDKPLETSTVVVVKLESGLQWSPVRMKQMALYRTHRRIHRLIEIQLFGFESLSYGRNATGTDHDPEHPASYALDGDMLTVFRSSEKVNDWFIINLEEKYTLFKLLLWKEEAGNSTEAQKVKLMVYVSSMSSVSATQAVESSSNNTETLSNDQTTVNANNTNELYSMTPENLSNTSPDTQSTSYGGELNDQTTVNANNTDELSSMTPENQSATTDDEPGVQITDNNAWTKAHAQELNNAILNDLTFDLIEGRLVAMANIYNEGVTVKEIEIFGYEISAQPEVKLRYTGTVSDSLTSPSSSLWYDLTNDTEKGFDNNTEQQSPIKGVSAVAFISDESDDDDTNDLSYSFAAKSLSLEYYDGCENTAETGQASQSSVRDDTQYHDADLANDDLLDTFSCTSGQWWSVKLVEATGHDPVLVRAVYITQVAERYPNNGLEALQVLTTMNYDSLADSPPSPSNPHWTAHTGPTDIQPQLSAVMVELITTQTAGSVIILAKGLAIYTTSDHGLFFSEVTVFQSVNLARGASVEYTNNGNQILHQTLPQLVDGMVHAESSSFQTIDNVNAYLEISTPATDLVDTVIIYTSGRTDNVHVFLGNNNSQPRTGKSFAASSKVSQPIALRLTMDRSLLHATRIFIQPKGNSTVKMYEIQTFGASCPQCHFANQSQSPAGVDVEYSSADQASNAIDGVVGTISTADNSYMHPWWHADLQCMERCYLTGIYALFGNPMIDQRIYIFVSELSVADTMSADDAGLWGWTEVTHTVVGSNAFVGVSFPAVEAKSIAFMLDFNGTRNTSLQIDEILPILYDGNSIKRNHLGQKIATTTIVNQSSDVCHIHDAADALTEGSLFYSETMPGLNQWWKVNLGSFYHIYTMEIYYSQGLYDGRNISMLVSNSTSSGLEPSMDDNDWTHIQYLDGDTDHTKIHFSSGYQMAYQVALFSHDSDAVLIEHIRVFAVAMAQQIEILISEESIDTDRDTFNEQLWTSIGYMEKPVLNDTLEFMLSDLPLAKSVLIQTRGEQDMILSQVKLYGVETAIGMNRDSVECEAVDEKNKSTPCGAILDGRWSGSSIQSGQIDQLQLTSEELMPKYALVRLESENLLYVWNIIILGATDMRGLGNFYLLSSLQAEDTSELLDFTSGEYNANWNVIAHVARPESPHRFDVYYQPALPLKGLAVHTREHELTIQEIVLFCHDDLLYLNLAHGKLSAYSSAAGDFSSPYALTEDASSLITPIGGPSWARVNLNGSYNIKSISVVSMTDTNGEDGQNYATNIETRMSSRQGVNRGGEKAVDGIISDDNYAITEHRPGQWLIINMKESIYISQVKFFISKGISSRIRKLWLFSRDECTDDLFPSNATNDQYNLIDYWHHGINGTEVVIDYEETYKKRKCLAFYSDHGFGISLGEVQVFGFKEDLLQSLPSSALHVGSASLSEDNYKDAWLVAELGRVYKLHLMQAHIEGGQRDSLSMSALATEPLLQRTNERPSINSEVWDVLATTEGAIPHGVFSHVIKPAYLTNNLAILWTQDIMSFQADLFTISDFSAFGFHDLTVRDMSILTTNERDPGEINSQAQGLSDWDIVFTKEGMAMTHEFVGFVPPKPARYVAIHSSHDGGMALNEVIVAGADMELNKENAEMVAERERALDRSSERRDGIKERRRDIGNDVISELYIPAGAYKDESFGSMDRPLVRWKTEL